MKERKPVARPNARASGIPARPRSKAAEAPRDAKVSALVEPQAHPKPADAAKAPVGGALSAAVVAPATAARNTVGTSKIAPVAPAPVGKVSAPSAKPAARSPAEALASAFGAPFKADLVAKSAPPASAKTVPAAQAAPMPRPVGAAKPAQDLERAVRAATAAVETAQPTASVVGAMSAASQFVPPAAKAVETGAEAVQQTSADLRTGGEATSRAVTDTARGWVELNSKMLDVLRAQSDAAFALWRDTVTARSFPDAVRAQTTGLQHLYETSTVQWREVAEAAARLMGDASKPMASAWPKRRA